MTPTKDEQNWGIGIHVSILMGYLLPCLGFVLPLILWLTKRGDSDYLNREGRKALNFIMTLLIASSVAWVLCLVLVGFFLLWVIHIFAVILVVLAAVKTADGEDFKCPLSFHFLK
jgi:uncharacterized protein